MPGPLPKDPKVRQRRNKTSTAATLRLGEHDLDVPELPLREELDEETGELVPIQWHPRTLEWWTTIWESPMAPEWLDADVEGLYLLAELEDDFHRATRAKERIELAKEIRLQRQCYGLTPIDRRRLQWEVDRGEEADERRRKRHRATITPQMPEVAPEGDPFSALR